MRPGDLVVTTPYTFASTSEVIRYFDALPVFVDIDPVTCNIDVDLARRAVEGLARGERSWLPPSLRETVAPRAPVALVPVQIGGIPCDVDGLYRLAGSTGMAVVEDAAHAVPTTQTAKSLACAAEHEVLATVCFSFYATKPISTGEGGMLVTDDARVAERARIMSLHGLSRDAWARDGAPGSWQYEIIGPGYKYNMTDVAAAMGLVQLAKAQTMVARRRSIAERYNAAFSRLEALELPTVAPEVASPWHLYMLRLHLERSPVDRDQLVEQLWAQGIHTSVHFIPLHLHRYYREKFGYLPEDFPIAAREFSREISLPLFSAMTDTEVDRVIEAVTSVITGAA